MYYSTATTSSQDASGERVAAHLLGRLPLGQLREALLAGPHGGVDDLQEQLAGAGVEDEDGAVDGLGGEVALEGLVDSHPVHVGVVHEPDDLVAEQLPVVLRAPGLGFKVRVSAAHGDQCTGTPWGTSHVAAAGEGAHVVRIAICMCG